MRDKDSGFFVFLFWYQNLAMTLSLIHISLCAAYSPFHCCCPLHFTIFWAFLSTDIQVKGEINGFCGKKLCHRIVAFSYEGGEGVILWAKGGEKIMEKPLDVLQDLYQKTDLVS